MLQLAGSPHWRTPGASHGLPNTLPGWMLALLALRGEWVARQYLLALLWPDLPPAAGQHNLRTNLHRVRMLLRGFACEEALATERSRVRLTLPLALDLDEQDAPPAELLAGFSLPGFPALDEWLALERAAHRGRWRDRQRQRCERCAPGAAGAAQRERLARALLAADELDEAALQVLAQALREQGRPQEATQAEQAWQARWRRELEADDDAVPPASALAPDRLLPAVPPARARHAFVGRRLERRQLLQALASPAPAGGAQPLVSLIGPGGIGKSRLAQDVFATLAAQTERSAWVDMHDLAHVNAVAARAAERLDLSWNDRGDSALALARRLAASGDEPVLLVLDNAEHLGELGGWLQRLRRAAPLLRVLVTSRARLGLADEQVLALDGLAVPDEDSGDPEAAAAFDAVALFAQHAQAVDPGFDLGAECAPVVAIVRRVGGMPLAIELAAGWLRLLKPAQVAQDLQQGFSLLQSASPNPAGSGRASEHANLAGLLQQTWQRLDPGQRQAMRDLAVFEGPFDATSAQAVAQRSLAALARLVDAGLVARTADERFALHPLLRETARARDAEDADPDLAARRHAEHFLHQVTDWSERVRVTGGHAMWRALEPVLSDIHAAWRFASTHGHLDVLGPAAAVFALAHRHAGRAREALGLLEPALQLPAGDPPAVRHAVSLRVAMAEQLMALGEAERGRELGLEAVRAAEALQMPPSAEPAQDQARLTLPRVAMFGRLVAAQCLSEMGSSEVAADELRQLLAQAGAQADTWLAARAHSALALALTRSGQPMEADLAFQRAISGMRALGIVDPLATTLVNHATLLQDLGRWQDSYDELLQVERLERQHKIRRTVPAVQVNLAFALIEMGQPEPALRHLTRAIDTARALDQPRLELGALATQVRAWLALKTPAATAKAEAGLRALVPRCVQAGSEAGLFEALRALGQYQAVIGQPLEAARTWLTVVAQPNAESGLRQSVELDLAGLTLDAPTLARLRCGLPPPQALAEQALAGLAAAP